MVIKLVLFYLRDIWEEVGEGVGEIGLAPSAGLKQHIHDGLLLDEVVGSLSRKALGYTRGLHVVDA